ncbi:MAG: hypothetical protein C5B57_03615 [Blastocatellia bacterium]|nr:MAG: hypothetical protein C5B57_03615 [Blastocatellia bacterium]
MSRVDEARRRAAELASFDTKSEEYPAGLAPLPAFDLAKLTIDSFPEEIPESPFQRIDPIHPPATSARVASSSAVTNPTPAEPVAPVARSSSSRPLAQSIDAEMSHKIVLGSNMAFDARGQYRHLAATLHNAQASSGVKAIMIASAVGGEGKTLTAANLALTLSESYERRVLLVDGNLRRPALHLLFGGNSNDPQEDVLPPGSENARVRQITPLLDILTGESPSSDPMADLTSKQMERALEDARKTYDWIIIDTPPILLLPDAGVLASMVDGAVLVVKAESTPFDLVQRAMKAIGTRKTLGVLLNAASARFHRSDQLVEEGTE